MLDLLYLICLFVLLMVTIRGIYLGMYCSTETAKWYYHYTDCKSMEAIKSSGCIKQSTDTERDAAYGKGAYLNRLHPFETPKEEVAVNNYTPNLANQKIKGRKVDCCFGILLKESEVKDFSGNGRNIFLYPGNILLSAVKHHIF